MPKQQKSEEIKGKSLEFQEKKALSDLNFERRCKEHEMKMQELTFIRESDRIKHEQELERQRIKSYEIRKAQERQDFQKFSR